MADEEKKKPSKKTAAPDPNADMMTRVRNAIVKVTKQKPLRPGDTKYKPVSTGSFNVDMLIGGTPSQDGKGLICPGFPRRHITEVYGAESSGKTTLAISAIVQAQRAGGTGMFIDFEHSIDLTYAQRIGMSMDESKLVVYQPDSMEDGLKMIYLGITAGIDIIVVDSVAAMVPKAELEKAFDENAKIGAVAAKFSSVLPKFVGFLQKLPRLASDRTKTDPDHPGTALVFINQMRAFISTSGGGGGYGDNENTSGGRALKYYAFERLRLARIKSESIERIDKLTGKKRRVPYGNVTDVKVVKSKIDAKQGQTTLIFIRYGTGIDDHFSLIETGVVQRMIKRDGAFYTFNGQRYQGKEKLRTFLIENPKVCDELRKKLVEAVNATAVESSELNDDDRIVEDFGDDADDDLAEIEDVLVDGEESEEPN